MFELKKDLPGTPIFLSPSSSLGGAERVLLSLLEPFHGGKLNSRPSVVCVETGPLVDELASRGISARIQSLPDKLLSLGDSPARQESRVLRLARLAMACPALWLTVRRWRQWLAADNPAWIHSNGFKTHLLSSWAAPSGCVVFWHLHDFLGERPLLRRLLHRAWRPGIEAIAISQAVADDFKRHLPQCPVHLWLNTVNTEIFIARNTVGNWLDTAGGLSEPWNGLRIGLVATYARWKGQEVFLQASKQILRELTVPVRFFIVGGPIYQTAGSQWSESELEKIIRDNGLEGKVGVVAFQKEAHKVYQALDVVVHASTRPEPFGLVIAEALACAKPVVAALHGGAAEIGIDGEHYLGHTPGDPASLAGSLIRLIRNEELRAGLGRSARQRMVMNFSQSQIMPRWKSLLSKCGLPC